MIVSFLNQKGGVGKTTLSINVAACFAKAGRRVLLIDADKQGSASTWAGPPRMCAAGRASSNVTIETVLKIAVVTPIASNPPRGPWDFTRKNSTSSLPVP